MAINYRLKISPQIETEDVPSLPKELQEDWLYFKGVLQSDPYKCDNLPWHSLRGKLKGFRAVEVEYRGDKNLYRLVFKICEKPSPRHVIILSFTMLDLAYEKAKARRRKE